MQLGIHFVSFAFPGAPRSPRRWPRRPASPRRAAPPPSRCAAWYEREHLGLGVPFPPLAERSERLEETLQICLQMWSDDDGPFDGKHYQLAETICSPRPLSAPRPPILVGGGGERKTLRLVARYADACNLFASSPADVAHKLAVLDRHCETEGRDPATVERTLLAIGNPLGDPEGLVATMADDAALGISTVEDDDGRWHLLASEPHQAAA